MDLISLKDFCDQKRAAASKDKTGRIKIPSDIVERWNQRVIEKHQFHLMGRRGAETYLDFYGKGIGVPKVVNLALKAEIEGYPEVASGFWARAYELETGHLPPANSDSGDSAALAGQGAGPVKRLGVAVYDPSGSVLPPGLQPGNIETMQPVDAAHAREHYIMSPLYLGQPKRDGNRLVIVVENGGVWYQSRKRNLRRAFSPEAGQGLLAALEKFGPFVLDGELYYLSAAGTEHRTGAQAATANFQAGVTGVQPRAVFGVFGALYTDGVDYRQSTEADRVTAGQRIAVWLVENGWGDNFEAVPTAWTVEEKRALCSRQKAEGREGEVWKQIYCSYLGGKGNNGDIIRTKYLIEVVGMVIGLTPTTAAGRPFGALEIGLPGRDGVLVSVGSVGTGFSFDQMAEIAQRYQQNPGGLRVLLSSQGYTEDGKLWQARFDDFADEDETLTLAPQPVAV